MAMILLPKHLCVLTLACGFQDTPLVQDLQGALERNASTLDGLYAEYELLTRITNVVEGVPDDLAVEIDISPNTWRTRFCWFRKGQQTYWERVDGVHSTHLVAWTNGETWSVFEPHGQSGVIQAHPPADYHVNPAQFFVENGTGGWGELVGAAQFTAVAKDIRFLGDQDVFRLELAWLGYPARRFVVCMDRAREWMVKRVYELTDDLLTKHYELKESEVLPSGRRIPRRYRVILTSYSPLGHFPAIDSYVEHEARLILALESGEIPLLPPPGFADGTVLTNDLARETSVVGTSFEDAYEGWARARPSCAGQDHNYDNGRPLWYWNSAAADSPASQHNSHSYIRLNDIAKDCGPVALYGLSRALGGPLVPLKELRARCSIGDSGTSIEALLSAAGSVGINLKVIRWENRNYPDLGTPFIALIERKGEAQHYVLAQPSADGEQWQVRDFPWHVHNAMAGDDWGDWTGIALVPDGERLREYQAMQGRTKATAAVQRVAGVALVAAGVCCVIALFMKRRKADVRPQPEVA